jgi:hypothetical protein
MIVIGGGVIGLELVRFVFFFFFFLLRVIEKRHHRVLSGVVWVQKLLSLNTPMLSVPAWMLTWR